MARRFSLARGKVTGPAGAVLVASGTTTVRDNVLRVTDGPTLLAEVPGVTAVRGVRPGLWSIETPEGTYEVARIGGGCGCGGRR